MTVKIPASLKKEIGKNKSALRSTKSRQIQNTLSDKSIHTVCNEALCPNKGKCFSRGEATFLILGDTCSRRCKFCAVKKGKLKHPDKDEPEKIADIVKKLGLRYVVITSPTRDDLPDGGASHYAKTIDAVKNLCKNTKTEVLIPDFAGHSCHCCPYSCHSCESRNPDIKIEVLVPDFAGSKKSLFTVLKAKPDVLAHNIETVPSLYSAVRQGANYKRSLKVIENIKRLDSKMPAKSGLMLGLGETSVEIRQTLRDLLNAGCDILTLGQYLAPSKKHNIVKKYWTPREFAKLKRYALNLGFKAVASAPLVRSSYEAGKLYETYKRGT